MNWIYYAYSAISIISALITAFLAVYTWQRRTAPGAWGFIGLMALTTLWTIGNVMQMHSGFFTQIFWHNSRFACIALIPVPWLVFSWQYDKPQKSFSWRSLAALCVLPGITITVIGYCTLTQRTFETVGWWYWIHTIYSFLLTLIGIFLVLRVIRQAEAWYRQRGMLVFAGIVLPLLVVTLHTLDWIPWYGMDFTSIAFTVTGVLFSRSLVQFRLFDLIPIARTLLIDSLEDPMVVLDNANYIVDLNVAAEQMLGRSRSELFGCESRQVFRSWESLPGYIWDTLSTRVEIKVELQGQQHYYDLRISPVYDQDQHLAGRLVLMRDMTEQKRTEIALRDFQRQLEASLQREQQRRQLSETLRDAVMIVSSTLEPSRVVGLLLDELRKVVVYHFASVMLAKDDQLTRLIRRSARGDSYRPLTFPVDAYPLNAHVLAHKLPVLIPDTRLDPRWKSSTETGDVCSLINTPLLVQDHPIGVLFIGRTDETAYTQEEVNILFAFATHVAIAVENARLAEQTRSALVDLQDTLERLQRTQKRLIESEKMAALGQLIAGVAHEINTPLGAIRASISNICAAMETSLSELPAVLRQLSSAQQDLFLAFVDRAVQKRPQLTSTEERKLRRRIQGELEAREVNHADDLADTLVDIGVHNEIEQFLPLFQANENRKIIQAAYHVAIQRHNSDNIVTAVDRVSKIAFALKSYGHYDHSGQKSQANVIESLETVLTLYHNQLKQGVQIVKQYGEPVTILCYPDELHQVWTNLIHNAIQAMDGKGTLEITVESKAGPEPAHDSFVVVRITDSGRGIPEAIKERIFEPFFTTKASGEGSGLGLDICRKIIEKHQGTIEVESRPGKTTFSVWLPNRNV